MHTPPHPLIPISINYLGGVFLIMHTSVYNFFSSVIFLLSPYNTFKRRYAYKKSNEGKTVDIPMYMGSKNYFLGMHKVCMD